MDVSENFILYKYNVFFEQYLHLFSIYKTGHFLQEEKIKKNKKKKKKKKIVLQKAIRFMDLEMKEIIVI